MADLKYAKAVYAKIGTENYSRYSNGNIFPVTALPRGMAEWCIQTDGAGGSWFYNPRHRTFEGIRLTHQPSPWVGDYCAVVFLPTSDNESVAENMYSSFRPEEAVTEPYLIRAKLLRFGVTVSLAPTERGGIFHVENASGRQSGFVILPQDRAELKICGRKVCGYTDGKYKFGQRDIREYLSVTFDCDIIGSEPLANGGVRVFLDSAEYDVRVAHGFISGEITELTLQRELGGSFASILSDAENAWENALSAIEVSREDEELFKLFYSCMYRALLYPIKFYELDAKGQALHFNPDINETRRGVCYTNNGFWDTFRTVYPLLSIIDRDAVREIVEGFINFGEEVGGLPRWLAPGDIAIMPGNLSEAVIADAAVKGIIDGDLLKRAYKLLVENGRSGRAGVADYIKYGYFPYTDHRESINETLDGAYGDFCISQVAKLLGDTAAAEEFGRRSQNYRNLFDAQTGFMRGKDREGNFRPDFDACDWGGDNCEGSYWQNSFAVYHDIDGLAELHGGKDKLIAKLDALFAEPPRFNVAGYGREIHEMSEMAAIDFGQCAISNQPSFHIPFLYSALGERKKTEDIVEKLVKTAFFANDCGFPGDEDNGTMASWVIFACLGFYPVCPGKAEYVASKPLFKEIKINGKRLAVWDKDIIKHSDI